MTESLMDCSLLVNSQEIESIVSTRQPVKDIGHTLINVFLIEIWMISKAIFLRVSALLFLCRTTSTRMVAMAQNVVQLEQTTKGNGRSREGNGKIRSNPTRKNNKNRDGIREELGRTFLDLQSKTCGFPVFSLKQQNVTEGIRKQYSLQERRKKNRNPARTQMRTPGSKRETPVGFLTENVPSERSTKNHLSRHVPEPRVVSLPRTHEQHACGQSLLRDHDKK